MEMERAEDNTETTMATVATIAAVLLLLISTAIASAIAPCSFAAIQSFFLRDWSWACGVLVSTRSGRSLGSVWYNSQLLILRQNQGSCTKHY
jgi:hypothetical protein